MKNISKTLVDAFHPVLAAAISVLVNYGGTFILVLQGANAAGLTVDQTASWIFSISIGVGITGAWLSYKFREPIITAWSTPGAAFLAAVLPSVPYTEAIGAYMVSALAFVLLGMSGLFEKVVKLIPAPIAAGLLAGILLRFGISAFGNAGADPVLVGLLFIVFVLLRRYSPRYAVVGILISGLALVMFRDGVSLHQISLKLAHPVFTTPAFSLISILSIAMPLFLITLTGQYMPGMLVLRNDGFKTSANPVLTTTGLGSLLMAPFGSHAFNIAAITAAICTGKESHPQKEKRYIAGLACGVFYSLVGIFGLTLASVFTILPSTFVASLAGLALLGAKFHPHCSPNCIPECAAVASCANQQFQARYPVIA